MKKTLIALFALLMATAAFADWWYIDWQIFSAASPNNEAKGVLDDYSVTWDLLWAASDSAADKLDAIVLGTRIADKGSDLWTAKAGDYTAQFDNYLTFTGEGDSTFLLDATEAAKSDSGFIYQKITLYDGGQEAYFWESSGATLSPVDNLRGNPGNIGGKDSEIGTASAAWTKVAAVPEPTTMALLGLGGLAMVLRRRIRR